jgi:hypothetical protein
VIIDLPVDMVRDGMQLMADNLKIGSGDHLLFQRGSGNL